MKPADKLRLMAEDEFHEAADLLDQAEQTIENLLDVHTSSDTEDDAHTAGAKLLARLRGETGS